MSAAQAEEQASSIDDNDDTANKDTMSISHAVSVSFSHSAASTNDADNSIMEGSTNHATMETGNHTPPRDFSPAMQEESTAGSMGLKSVMPSFRTTLDDDGSDDENSSQKSQQQQQQQQQQQHPNTAMALPLTQHNPNDDDSDEGNNSDAAANYASSSSSDDNHDENDDGSSDSDDESVDGDAPDVSKSPNPMFTDAARAQRLLRNKEKQIELGLVMRSPQPGQNIGSPTLMSSPSEPPTPRPLPQQQLVRGMIFSTPYNSSPGTRNAALNRSASLFHDEEDAEDAMLEELEQLYPHRQAQIMQLWSLLSPCLPPMTSNNDSHSVNGTRPTTTMTHHVPPPIFITGPAGTGKSTIVRDVVSRLQESRSTQYHYLQQPHRIGSAYINCATLDRRNSNGKAFMDEILHEAYRQLAQDMKESGRVLDYASWRRRRKRKRKTPKRALMLSSPAKSVTKTVAGLPAHATKTSNSSSKRQRRENGEAAVTNETRSSRMEGNREHRDIAATKIGIKENDGNSSKGIAETEKVDESPKVRRSRRVSELADADISSNIDTNGYIKEKRRNSIHSSKAKNLINSISSDLDATATAAAKDGDLTAVATAASRTAHIAAASFGQELKETLFRHEKDCAFLILDQAEQLLSVPASSSTASAKTNFLAQLLLLPRTKGLNLTIIVITKSIVLEHSRFNNLVFPDKSLSTLSTALQPLHIHCQAYKGKESIKQILSRPALLERVVGPNMMKSYVSGKDKFNRQVVKSFLNTLVQTLYGSTRDIKEIVRLGRLLWPVYVKPLHSTHIEKTMKSVQNMMPLSKASAPTVQGNGKQILSFLDQQILPQIRSKVEHCLYSFTGQDKTQRQQNSRTISNHIQQPHTFETARSSQGMAYLSKCLLLAAFICQTNRPDKDKHLFTIQKNGKKNSANKRKSHGEDLAFGSSRNVLSKGYRPRMYPMERMLSVFVSIVGLNQGQQLDRKGKQSSGSPSITPGSIGSSDFFEALSHLRDIGIIHDKASRSSSATDIANLVTPKFWSSTTRDEADIVATSIGFPLDEYLL